MRRRYDPSLNVERKKEIEAAQAAAWRSREYPFFQAGAPYRHRYLIDERGVVWGYRFPRRPPCEDAIKLAELFLKDADRVKHPVAGLWEVATIARRRYGQAIDLGAVLLAAKRLEFGILGPYQPGVRIGVSMRWLHEQPESISPHKFNWQMVSEPDCDLIYTT